MKWFRFYAEVVDDPKVQLLPPKLFRLWVNLLCICSLNEGQIPSVSHLSFRIRVSEKELSESIGQLIKRGLLVENADGYKPHKWEERQYQSDNVTLRTRKHREKQKRSPERSPERLPERSRNDTGTPSDTDTDTDTETTTGFVQAPKSAASPVSSTSPPQLRPMPSPNRTPRELPPPELRNALSLLRPDEAAVLRLWQECRSHDPTATAREIAAMACATYPKPNPRVANPMGLILLTVPSDFADGGSTRLRAFRAENRPQPVATQAPVGREA